MDAFLSVIDHGITINWEHGPTLHKLLAQVRYRSVSDDAADTPVITMRIGASQRCAEATDDVEDAYCFAASNGDLAAQWIWQAHQSGWSTNLILRNISDESIAIEAIDLVRIDAQTGLFTLGAPVTAWQMAMEPGQLRVWATQSDRGEPMAVYLEANPPPDEVIDQMIAEERERQGGEDRTLEQWSRQEVETTLDPATEAAYEAMENDPTIPVAIGDSDDVAIRLDLSEGRFNSLVATFALSDLVLAPNAAILTPGILVWTEPAPK